jgi:hypothetical protein
LKKGISVRKCASGVFLNLSAIVLWMLLLAIRWNYFMLVMHPGEALGEPIWYHDPFGFWTISFACTVVAFAGLWLIFSSRLTKNGEIYTRPSGR